VAQMSRLIDMTGQTFGWIEVLGMLPPTRCSVRCRCGHVWETESYAVRKGRTTSCGCRPKRVKHGESIKPWTPEYRAWVNMITRCHNPNATRWIDWGGRGIVVCEEWRTDYPAFLAHMGRKPSPRHSLDRYPNADGHYAPGNVRWATPREQTLNSRKARIIEFHGERRALKEWAEYLGINYGTLWSRLDESGWDVETAFTTSTLNHHEIAAVAGSVRRDGYNQYKDH
jgi:hypothetical protein